MGEIVQFLSSVSDFKSILGIGTGLLTLSLLEVTPRVGFGRALRLGFRRIISNRFQGASPQSVRTDEIAYLKNRIKILNRGQYIVVTGGKGVGKTCMIDTAIQNDFGVVYYGTHSGADKPKIMDGVLRDITGIKFSFLDLHSNARRVIKCHQLLFRNPPIVVISVPERGLREEYAMVSAAVRGLVDEFKLKVLVDGSPNSIPPDTLSTERQVLISVNEMRKDQIESIADFNELITFMRENKISDGVWEVLGGNPADYVSVDMLYKSLIMKNVPKDIIVGEIKKHIYSVLLSTLTSIILKCSANTENIIEMLRDRNITRIAMSELKANSISLDYPNKVFREAIDGNVCYVEPSSSAVTLIISGNIKYDKDINHLHETLFTPKVDAK